MMALNRNLAHVKNSSSLTFQSIHFFVSKSRDMSRDYFAKKSLIIDQLVAALRKEIEQ